MADPLPYTEPREATNNGGGNELVTHGCETFKVLFALLRRTHDNLPYVRRGVCCLLQVDELKRCIQLVDKDLICD